MQSVETMTEQILYWLSLDMQVRALAERLLERFAVTVGDLPASAAHHHAEPGGLYRHSLEVALKALEEFEGNMIMEKEELTTVQKHSRAGYNIAALLFFFLFLDNLLRRAEGQGWKGFWPCSGRFEVVVLFGMLSLVAPFVYWSRIASGPQSRARLKP